jgi:phosphoglucosamine mutase
MEVMLESKSALSDLMKEISIFPQLLVNVKVHNKKSAREDQAVVDTVAQVERELGNDGRILVRESGTEPVVRVMVEAESKELCKEMVYRVIDVMKEKGHVL